MLPAVIRDQHGRASTTVCQGPNSHVKALDMLLHLSEQKGGILFLFFTCWDLVEHLAKQSLSLIHIRRRDEQLRAHAVMASRGFRY
jgi:hypothetical protein